MKRNVFLSLTLLFGSLTAANAGVLSNNVWSTLNCGIEPVAPLVDQSSVDAFNKSIDTVNQWRDKAEAFNNCLIKEANEDSALIAKAANSQQDRLQAAIEKINNDTDAAKEKFDKKK